MCTVEKFENAENSRLRGNRSSYVAYISRIFPFLKNKPNISI